MFWKSPRRLALLAATAGGFSMLLSGCASTSINGRVVSPDGSALRDVDVIVYTAPRSQSVKARANGAFKIDENVVPDNDYTLIAEDKDGNTGYVRGYKPVKGKNPDVIVRMSREVQAKDAVLEGEAPVQNGIGPGEKIFKSSQ